MPLLGIKLRNQPCIVYFQHRYFNAFVKKKYENTNRLKVKGWKKIPIKIKAGIFILITAKVDFRTKNINRDKGDIS